jgi:hypothetical protein
MLAKMVDAVRFCALAWLFAVAHEHDHFRSTLTVCHFTLQRLIQSLGRCAVQGSAALASSSLSANPGRAGPRSDFEARIRAVSGPEAAMDATKTFRHQGYDLFYGARPVDSGKFAPALVVSKQVWPTRPRVIDVRRGHYSTEDMAIDAARNQGVEWILSFG